MSDAENGNIFCTPENEYSISVNGLEKWTAQRERLSVTHQTGGLKRLAVDCGDLTLWEIFLTGEQAEFIARLLLANDAAATVERPSAGGED